VTRNDDSAQVRVKAGRPRDPRLDEAVVAATLQLLAEEGYAQLTVERIAARAGVGKASLYRRWPDKVSIVLEAVSRNPERPSTPDTGSLRGDALAYLQTLVRYRTLHADAISAISSEALCNAQFGDAFRAGMAEPTVAGMLVILQRAIERGEIDPGTDIALLSSVPPALLHTQRLVSGRHPDETFVRRIVDQFFSAAGEVSASTVVQTDVPAAGPDPMNPDESELP
jgi:AcrR family transcriptional regulator